MKRIADMSNDEIAAEVIRLRLLWNSYTPPTNGEAPRDGWVIDRMREVMREEARRRIAA